MSKNKHRKGQPAPPPSEQEQPLPREVMDPHAEQSAREKQRAREENEMFTALRRELGTGGFVTLQRAHPGTGQYKSAYIGQLPIENFSIEQVTETYGGGDYIAKGRTASGTFTAEHRFTVDHTILPKNPKTTQTATQPAAPAVDPMAVMKAAEESAMKQVSPVLELAKAIIASGQKDSSGSQLQFLQMILASQEKQAAQFTEMLKQSESRTAKILEQMADARESREPESLEMQLEKLLRLQQVAKQFAGDGAEPEEGWKGIIKDGIAAVAPILQQHFGGAAPGPISPDGVQAHRQIQRVAPPQVIVSPAAAPQTAQPAGADPQTQPQPSTQDEEMNAQVKLALSRFRSAALAAAEEGEDAYTFVKGILRFVPSNYYAAIWNTANSPDWFTAIFGTDADAQRHIPYLAQVRNCVLARALVAHAQGFRGVMKPAGETAQAFINWLNPDVREADEFFNLTEPENWVELFAGAFKNDAAAADTRQWLEAFRVELARLLDEDDEAPTAEVVPMTPAPAAEEKPKAARKGGRK